MIVKPCLFDLDGTLANHTESLMRDLAKIQSPGDPPITRHDYDEPEWAKERKRLIRSQRDWWLNLSEMPLGFDLYHIACDLGFQIYVLTKGPWTTPHAWTEKVLWCRKHLLNDTKIIISEDKSLVYGRVLVDDYIPYVIGWMEKRPRGLVIMPGHEENENYIEQAEKFCKERPDLMTKFWQAVEQKRLIRYNGFNIHIVKEEMERAFNR